MENEILGTTNATTEPVTTLAETTIPAREIEIDYLGNKETISLDDVETVKSLLQKGKDYQRIHDKYETSKTILSKAEKIARKYGYRNEDGQGTIEEFLDTIDSNFDSQTIGTLVNDGIPEETAKELIELRKKNEEAERIKQEYQTREQKKQQELDFLEYFKMVNHREFSVDDKIPPEVLKKEKEGTPLKYAYADYLARESAKKADIERKNTENKETSAPPMSSTGLEKNTFTEAEVRSMSREEVAKNFKAIMESKKLPSWKK